MTAQTTPPPYPTDSRRSSLFVGRARELEELSFGLDALHSGRGHLFLVSGEPGIGKTRLTHELSASARALGALVLWGRCWEGGGAPAYWPWLQLISAYARAVDEPTLARSMDQVSPHLAQLVPDLSEMVGGIAGVASAGSESEQARFALFDAIATFWRNAARARPLMLVLDDLHAADQPSLLLLRFVARELHELPVLLVGTYRDGEVRAEPERVRIVAELGPEATNLPLRGLCKNEAAELAEAIASRPLAPVPMAALHRATGGNPFFLRELVRLLMAEGRLDRPELLVGDVGVPDLVRWTIARRLESLPSETMELLGLAAVIGQELDLRLLGRAAVASPDRLLALLDPAVVMGILEVQGRRARFTHALVHETLYADLDMRRRVELHRRVGEALEVEHAADLGSALPALAKHFLAAAEQQPERAIEYTARAGERALELLAYEDAASYFTRALGLLEDQGIGDGPRRWSLLMGLAAATRRAGDGEAATAALRRAATEARRLASAEHLARTALSFPPGVTGGVVDPERVALLEEVLAALGEDDGALRARVMACLAWELFWGDTPERCDVLSREAVAMARRIGDKPTLAFTLNAARYAVWGMENIEERLAIATELLQLARSAGDRELVMESHHWRVLDLLELGDIAAVDREIEAHARMAAELRQPLYLWWSAMWQTTRATMAGRFAEAERLANQAVAIGERVLSANAASAFQTQLLLLSREQGRLTQIAAGFEGWMRAQPAVGASVRCGLAQILSELGREADARVEFEHLSAGNFGGLGPMDVCASLCALAETCAFLADPRRAAMILERLAPYAGRNVVIGPAIGTFGPVARFFGLLTTAMRRWDEAEKHFSAALDFAVRMAAPPFVARTQHDYAAMLVARDAPGDRPRAQLLLDEAIATARRLGMARVAERGEALRERISSPIRVAAPSAAEQSFCREGDFWRIVFDGSAAQIKDSEGLHYLAQLLASPGRPFHVLELVARGHSRRNGDAALSDAAPPEIALADAGMRFAWLGDAGAILDEQAKSAYQRRLVELEIELDEAHAANDLGRSERLRSEFEALVAELSAALGFRGRNRRAVDVAERARTSVAKALRRAIARIQASHPSLGHHLASTMRTGIFCLYSPDPRLPIDWNVSAAVLARLPRS